MKTNCSHVAAVQNKQGCGGGDPALFFPSASVSHSWDRGINPAPAKLPRCPSRWETDALLSAFLQV